MFVIARPINGISINGDEYLRDIDNNLLLWNTKKEAEDYFDVLSKDLINELYEEELLTAYVKEMSDKEIDEYENGPTKYIDGFIWRKNYNTNLWEIIGEY